MSYTINELSKMFHLAPSTLRYYEELGLLINVTHTDKKQRIYTDEHIARLHAIQCFKQTGLPLAKIQLFFEYEKNLPEHIKEIIELMTTQEKGILEQIRNLENGLAHIRHKIRFYNGICEAIQEDKAWPCWEDFAKPPE